MKWVEVCIYLLDVGQLTGDGSIAWGLGERLSSHHQKRIDMLQNVTQGLGHEHPFEQCLQWKMDMGLGMQEVCKLGLLKIVSRELVKYRLDLMGVQEVSWD